MELLCKAIRSSAVIAFYSIVEQCSQRASSVAPFGGELLKRIASALAFLRVFRTNLQCCKIESIQVVLWFFLYCGCELFLLLGKITFCARQPASNDMKRCAVPIVGRDSTKRL